MDLTQICDHIKGFNRKPRTRNKRNYMPIGWSEPTARSGPGSIQMIKLENCIRMSLSWLNRKRTD